MKKLVLLSLVVMFALTACGGSKHKAAAHATCWTPTYAANPTANWAKNPSATHRHGKGPLGSNVCGGK